jgi:Putative MetA-pathway of phenol degradation
LDINSEVAWSSTSLNQRFALSYTGERWNLTANVIWGSHFDHVTGNSQLSPCPAPFALNGCNPDFLNVDLTATRKFGDWEAGLVAFGSTDLNVPVTGYQKQSQVAVGALIGHSFGPVILQAYLTTARVRKELRWTRHTFVGAFHHPSLAAPNASHHAALSERIKRRCTKVERCEAITGGTPPVSTRPGKTLGFPG